MSSRNKKTGDFNAIGRGANQPLFRFFFLSSENSTDIFSWIFLFRGIKEATFPPTDMLSRCAAPTQQIPKDNIWNQEPVVAPNMNEARAKKRYEDQVPSGGGYDFPRLKHYL